MGKESHREKELGILSLFLFQFPFPFPCTREIRNWKGKAIFVAEIVLHFEDSVRKTYPKGICEL
jgi:hypothetical protein